MTTPYLSVIVPSYDEMANLRKGVLERIKNFLEKQKFAYEVIVVDDGSKDGSIGFVEAFVKENKHFSLMQNKHLGKAGAVTAGRLTAKGEYILFTDMDQATPIEETANLLKQFRNGFDVVIGSRTVRNGSPWSRKIVSMGLIICRKFIVGLPEIRDTNCGFKMFSQKACKDIFQKIYDIHHGFSQISGSAVKAGFDVELLLIAEKMGYKIKEVPVEWLYVESRRVSPIWDSLDGFKELLRIRLNDVSGKYSV
ncbi:MAG TPA: glycosyltransferase [Patescibacteria group bacterium]|nr:glycosyltransferase [Patescibacteria group bacterium]